MPGREPRAALPTPPGHRGAALPIALQRGTATRASRRRPAPSRRAPVQLSNRALSRAGEGVRGARSVLVRLVCGGGYLADLVVGGGVWGRAGAPPPPAVSLLPRGGFCDGWDPHGLAHVIF